MRVEAENRVVHGGTYTGSPVALAAAAAVLTRVRDDAGLYDALDVSSARLAGGIEAAFADAGIEGHVRRVGSMLQPFLRPRPPEEPRTTADAAQLQDDDGYGALCDALEQHGVYAHRYPLGRWFVSTAHDGAIVDETLTRVAAAVREYAMLSS